MLEVENIQSSEPQIKFSEPFSGYASVFDNIDEHGDIIKKGAFAESLLKKEFKMLLFWQHGPEPVGEIIECYEDHKGLRIVVVFFTSTCKGNTAFMLSKQYSGMTGLSIAFRIKNSEIQNGIRIITDVELFEVSMVTNAANRLARLD